MFFDGLGGQYVRIKSVDLSKSCSEIKFNDGQTESIRTLKDDPDLYSPVTIRPWTLEEAKAEMKKGTQVLSGGVTYSIDRVCEYADGTVSVKLDPVSHNLSWRYVDTTTLANENETLDHRSCGTPVPQ